MVPCSSDCYECARARANSKYEFKRFRAEDMGRYYGFDSNYAEIMKRQMDEFTRAMFVPQMPLPTMAGPPTDYQPLETKMTETKPLPLPIKLLVDALATKNVSRSATISNAVYYETSAQVHRKTEKTLNAEIAELTKALKKLGHKA